MEPNPTQEPIKNKDKEKDKEDPRRKEKTTIQILKGTAEDLTECKRGADTYDDVINKHMDHFKKYNP